ncbi:MAG: hypothetical protein R8K49_06070, partial [Mariprofundaceae bacterium]
MKKLSLRISKELYESLLHDNLLISLTEKRKVSLNSYISNILHTTISKDINGDSGVTGFSDSNG